MRTELLDDDGIKVALEQAVSKIGFESKQVKSVLIKPNLCYYWDYSTGETTDPRVVSALIDYIRQNCSSDAEISIIESDASAMKAKYAFKMLGYEDLAEKKKVALVNLCDDEPIEKEVTVSGHSLRFTLPRMIFDADLFVNVPKLKVGPFASGKCLQITCALKNLFGCVHEWRKVRFHPHLDEAIVGVNKLIKPHLVVVDGVVALGKKPIKLGLVMAGTNSFAVDVVASRIMGYNPSQIKYLQMAQKEGLGNFEEVSVLGERIDNLRKLFPKRNHFFFKASWNMQLGLLGLYVGLVNDTLPSVLERK